VSEPRATVRRAPKVGAFVVVGGLIGLLVTLVLTSLQPADPNVGFFALFAYFSLYGIPAGIALGALVALVLDAVSRRRAKSVAVEVERGQGETE
jgi:ABC-type Co2+ transport system permease subunit